MARPYNDNGYYQKMNEIAHAINQLRKKAIVPILKEGKLFLYEIRQNEKFDELERYYESKFSEVYDKLILDDENLKRRLIQQGSLQLKYNVIQERPATAEEIKAHFHLDQEENRKDFLKQNAQEIEVILPIDDEIYTKAYRKETIDEVVGRIKQQYLIYTYKKGSKIAEVMQFIKHSNYINLDLITSVLYKFIDGTEVEFMGSQIEIVEPGEKAIQDIVFNDVEEALSKEEKISILKEILASLDIECIYCEDFNKPTKSLIMNFVNTKWNDPKVVMINFAQHNTQLLNMISNDFPINNHKMKTFEQ